MFHGLNASITQKIYLIIIILFIYLLASGPVRQFLLPSTANMSTHPLNVDPLHCILGGPNDLLATATFT
jgi:hypothetical protein